MRVGHFPEYHTERKRNGSCTVLPVKNVPGFHPAVYFREKGVFRFLLPAAGSVSHLAGA